jgi:AraC family transcriptional activator of pobA
MDKTGKRLDVTGQIGGVDGRTPRGTLAKRSGKVPPRHDTSLTTRLRSEVVRSYFVAREWRLTAEGTCGFQHGLLVQSGEAWLAFAPEGLRLAGPCFAWLPAGSVDRLEIAAGARGHLLAMQPDLLENTFRQIPEATGLIALLAAEQPLVLRLEGEVSDLLGRVMSIVSRELQAPGPGSGTLISSALVICFVELWRHIGTGMLAAGHARETPALLTRFRQLVEEHFREQWSVTSYAEQLGLTPDRLHAICTRQLGRPPRVLIQQRVMNEAIARLETSAITTKQLAFILGFKDPGYFNRFFMRQMGLPPGRYRREVATRDAAQRARSELLTFADWP